MTIHEFGKGNAGTVVLFHPLGVRWDIFSEIVPILEQDYHLVIPALPGFDEERPEADFTSVEAVAADMAAWLIRNGYGRIACLYGCSMGGGVAARILAERKLDVGCAVMDGGMTPYPLWKPLTYLIGVRDFLMMELGKHASISMLRSMFDPDKYSEEDLAYAKEVLSAMSPRTIWRAFYSCNNYAMPDPVPRPDCPVQYWYGAEEKKARAWDIRYIRNAFPEAELVELPGMGHAEYFTLHPAEFCQRLTAFILASKACELV